MLATDLVPAPSAELGLLEAAVDACLMFAEWGDLAGSPVFALHGTPSCRLYRHPNEELARSTGAHLVTYDRPGSPGECLTADPAGWYC